MFKYPEKRFPRRFDIFGTSHQILHVMVVLAGLVHMFGVLQVFDFYISMGILVYGKAHDPSYISRVDLVFYTLHLTNSTRFIGDYVESCFKVLLIPRNSQNSSTWERYWSIVLKIFLVIVAYISSNLATNNPYSPSSMVISSNSSSNCSIGMTGPSSSPPSLSSSIPTVTSIFSACCFCWAL